MWTQYWNKLRIWEWILYSIFSGSPVQIKLATSSHFLLHCFKKMSHQRQSGREREKYNFIYRERAELTSKSKSLLIFVPYPISHLLQVTKPSRRQYSPYSECYIYVYVQRETRKERNMRERERLYLPSYALLRCLGQLPKSLLGGAGRYNWYNPDSIEVQKIQSRG